MEKYEHLNFKLPTFSFQTDKRLFENAESIYFAGKCVTALAADQQAIKHTGKTILTTELAELYNLKDIDGSESTFDCVGLV